MRTNKVGLDLIKQYEGLRLISYPDPATGSTPYTVGYGHTGPEVKLGMKITQEQADEYLIKDIKKIEGDLVGLGSLTDNQFSAIVSLAYNVGLTNVRKSILYAMAKGGSTDKAIIALEFIKWSKANGKVMPGLVKRRAAETILFLT